MGRILALCLVIFAGFSAQGLANPVEGQEAPAFAAAVEDWLAGDEAHAIPALADLAKAGNAAARLQLGLIDSTPAYQGDWLGQLPRERRIALLRAPGGISGVNWLDQTPGPLAAAWVDLRDQTATADLVLTFARLNEPRAAHMAARQLALRERRGFGAIADDPAFPPSLLPLAIRDWQRDDPARAERALATLPEGHPDTALTPATVKAEALLAWAQSDPQLSTHLQTLARLCPGSDRVAQDLAAHLSQSGGFWALAWLGPPSSGLIDPARYAMSPKAAEVARNLLRAGAVANPGAMAQSPCLQSLMGK